MFASKDIFLTPPSGGYTIARSVRLRSSASAYFNRTPASASNQQKWTWSGWLKRGQLGVLKQLFTAGSGTTTFQMYFNGSGGGASSVDGIELFGNNAGTTVIYYTSTAVRRDPSAWYHIVLAIDTTQATAGNRVLLWVNNQLTDITGVTVPAQNTNLAVNSTAAHYLGQFGSTSYFDGYMTEVNFIDGQALTPSSFGSTNAITGVWQPAKYTGTYGTNGFYLNFSDNSSNTSTTIGKDYSGNGNNWTPNNISVTAGVTYDSMTDVPTLTSATAANYPVWNPLDKGTSSGSTSNANLNCNPNTSTSVYGMTTTMEIPITGKYYFELLIGSTGGSGQAVICLTPQTINSVANGGYNNTGCFAWVLPNNEIRLSGSAVTTGVSFAANDVIGVAVNNGIIAFYKNNTLIYTYSTNMSSFTGPYVAMFSGSSNASTSINFGQRPFYYTPPTGFVALNTYNLPASTIKNGAAYMAATAYTGTGATNSISNAVNGVSFQPDFVWVKARGNTYSHNIEDSVRGVTLRLQSDSTAAEAVGANGQVTAFSSGGFTQNGGVETGGSSATYVAWQWKAGGTSSSNTNGSITSTVSVGATQGFSVVTYTGTGTAGTVGHGLGVAPAFIIAKSRNNAVNWITYHQSLGKDAYMNLNTTNASASLSNYWGTSVNSSTFGFLSNAYDNANGNMVAYCFAAVAGYSAFGSYTGNGSGDGTFVYLGFRPRFVLIKISSGVDNWFIFDTARGTYNDNNPYLLPNTSGAEGAFSAPEMLSNGFKLNTTSTALNGSGSTYIYAAFAENPFKYALAR